MLPVRADGLLCKLLLPVGSPSPVPCRETSVFTCTREWRRRRRDPVRCSGRQEKEERQRKKARLAAASAKLSFLGGGDEEEEDEEAAGASGATAAALAAADAAKPSTRNGDNGAAPPATEQQKRYAKLGARLVLRPYRRQSSMTYCLWADTPPTDRRTAQCTSALIPAAVRASQTVWMSFPSHHCTDSRRMLCLPSMS